MTSKNYSWILIVILCVSLLNMGTIRRKQNQIRNTQTDPIKFDKKMEEEKDGKKGAPLPSMTLYGGEPFLAELPMDEPQKEDQTEKPEFSKFTEDLPEGVVSEASEDEALEEDWWWFEEEES